MSIANNMQMGTGKKIVTNTAILYGRILITIGISLYSTRLILNHLGAADFGLYNVVGGIIAMLSFLNAAMTISTQRFLSFNMGLGDADKIKRVLGNSILMHTVLGLSLVVAFELVGIYFLDTALTIAPDRLSTAKLIFHFAVAASFASIISVPYDAVVNAHENMAFVAAINILESILKLAIAILLAVVLRDKLLVYGFLIMVSAILVRVIKQVYCRKKYPECSVRIFQVYDWKLIKEMSSFAGWNLFGVICGLSRSQGLAIVLNVFYGTVVNAAYAIANQVNSQMSFLSMIMMQTIRPQMMKSEGAGDRARMLRLSTFAGKFSFYLNSIISIPLFITMPQVLELWLGEVPAYTVSFCRYMLVLNLTQQFSMGIMAATQAIGTIKNYQLVVGTVQILTVPIGYFALKAGYPPDAVMISTVGLEFVASFFRVLFFRQITSHSIPIFLKKVVLAPMIPSIIVFVVTYWLYSNMVLTGSAWQLIPFFSAAILCYITLIYLIGISAKERTMINDMVRIGFANVIKVVR